MTAMPRIDLKRIAELSNVPISVVTSMVAVEAGRYRRFSIPKRSGGRRDICTPVPSLMSVQRAIKEHILDNVILSESATGFRVGYSIRDHVLPHASENKIIKIDIKDCFPSINIRMIINVFRKMSFPPRLAYCLARLVTHGGCLPQGAPTSPPLCNIVLGHLDNRLSGLCRSAHLKYTRYADDIVISGEGVSRNIFQEVKEIIGEEGFAINEKSKLMIDATRVVLCGISISTGVMKIPKSAKRSIRKSAHFIMRNGVIAESSRDHIDPFFVDRVLGRLAYWQFVEPEALFPRKLSASIRSLYLAEIGVRI